VNVQLGDANASAVAGADGRWMVKLPPQKAGGPLEMTVAGKTSLKVKDILIGDVWVCSGQSNMAFGLGGCLGSADDIREANYPQIRIRNIGNTTSASPVADVDKGAWRAASPKTAMSFTGVGFYFARDVYNAVGVPTGLIETSWSGTSIGPWWAPEGLPAVPELADTVKAIADQQAAFRAALPAALDAREAWIKTLRQALDANGAATRPATVTGITAALNAHEAWIAAARAGLAGDGNIPTAPSLPPDFVPGISAIGEANKLMPPALPPGAPGTVQSVFAIYNGRIKPLAPYAIKGVIWYQGENNGMEGDSYFHKMRALVGGWRQVWGQGDFPFYFVQLTAWQKANDVPAGGDGWAKVRAAQAKSMSIANTGMAVTYDVGDANDIHPTNKYDVGHRLALWALAKDYGQKDLVYSGPMFRQMKADGGRIVLSFDHIGGGLMVGKKEGRLPVAEDKEGKLARFAIAGEDKVWHWAEAKIEGDTVVVWSDKVAKPVAVRYAYSWNPSGANLYNRAGLPACPFRTDDW
jgi:sialate O-acetylesterase